MAWEHCACTAVHVAERDDSQRPQVAYPATHGTRAGASSKSPPYGARLRLKTTFEDARVTTLGAKAVFGLRSDRHSERCRVVERLFQ